MASFSGLLTKHVAASIDKQQSLLKVVGEDAKAKFDLKKGTLSFTNGQVFDAQLLGVESAGSRTWRWAWGEGAENLPDERLVKARQIRDAAEKAGIAELATPKLPLEGVDGRQIALVSVGITKSDCFFKVQQEGRSLYLLLSAPPVRTVNDTSPGHVSGVFFTVIQNFDIGHRDALGHYLTYKGYTIDWQGQELHGTSPGGEHVKAVFTEQGKLMALTTRDADDQPAPIEEVELDELEPLDEAEEAVVAEPAYAPAARHGASRQHAPTTMHAPHSAPPGRYAAPRRRGGGVGMVIGIVAVLVVMVGALIVGAVIATQQLGGGGTGNWQPFSMREVGLTVSAPGRMRDQSGMASLQAGGLPMRAYAAEVAGGEYAVMTSDVDPTVAPTQVLNIAAESVTQGEPMVRDSQSRHIDVGGVEGRRVSFVDRDGDKMDVQLFIVGRKLVQVITVTKPTGAARDLAVRFHESVRFGGNGAGTLASADGDGRAEVSPASRFDEDDDTPHTRGWQTLRVPEVGLSIETPVAMRRETSRDSFGNASHMYNLTYGDAELGVVLSSLAPGAGEAALDDWEQAQRQSGNREQVTVNADGTIPGVPARRATYLDGAGRQVEIRAMAVNDYLVQVVTSAPPGSSGAQADTRRFHMSLSIDPSVVDRPPRASSSARPSVRRPGASAQTPAAPAAPKSLDAVLDDLRSGEADRIRSARRELSRLRSQAPRSDVAEAIIEVIRGRDRSSRTLISGELEHWVTPKNLGDLQGLLVDADQFTKDDVLSAIGRIPDATSVQVLIEHLDDPFVRSEAIEGLKNMGVLAEQPVIDKLNATTDRITRIELMRLLADIGTPGCREVLEKLAEDSDRLTSVTAQSLLRQMDRR